MAATSERFIEHRSETVLLSQPSQQRCE